MYMHLKYQDFAFALREGGIGKVPRWSLIVFKTGTSDMDLHV